MIPRLIRTEGQYEAALAHVDGLMSAEPGTPEMDELELWVHLVETYEEARYPIGAPSPVAAIRFRMEQQGLRPSDLVPFMGSKSRVSEVLSGRRTLSLAMIRKLSQGLSIPADVLIQETHVRPSSRYDDVDWSAFPLAQMAKRRWFGDAAGTSRELRESAEELLGSLLHSYDSVCNGPTALRQSAVASPNPTAPALWAWRARVWQLAQKRASEPLAPEAIDGSFISQIARLSVLDDGPLVARDVLAKTGVSLVVEPQLPGTRLDGAAMRCGGGAIIGLTLRYDRLDYFWFTLCHELAHLALHLRESDSPVIMDDLEAGARTETEEEADLLAVDALIPRSEWGEFMGSRRISEADVVAFARKQRLHPAIVAGRYRRETGDYTRFGSLLGSRRVRSLFLGSPDASEQS
jgi:HTH-type transcriptional regulator/antitoxin HigA